MAKDEEMACEGTSPVLSATTKEQRDRENDTQRIEAGQEGRHFPATSDTSRSSGQEPTVLDKELPLTSRRLMSFVAMAMLWTSSQAPLYLFGKCRTIYQ